MAALETSLEDKCAWLEGEDVIEDKQANSLQTSSQGDGLPKLDGQVAVILSKVSLSSFQEGSGRTESQNSITEPNSEVNQNLEALDTLGATCTPMQRDHPSDCSRSPLPSKKLQSPPKQEATKQDMVPRQPIHLGCPSTGDDEMGKETVTDLEEKQKECAALDAMTLSSREICKDTYQRLDHLEETIRDLEMSISQISCQASTRLMFHNNLLEQLGPKDVQIGERQMDASVSRCSQANFENVESDCQDLRLCEASNSPPKSYSKPPLLPKPQFLLNGNLQVHVFDISLVLLYLLIPPETLLCRLSSQDFHRLLRGKGMTHLKTRLSVSMKL